MMAIASVTDKKQKKFSTEHRQQGTGHAEQDGHQYAEFDDDSRLVILKHQRDANVQCLKSTVHSLKARSHELLKMLSSCLTP
jgi:hypothetical protein